MTRKLLSSLLLLLALSYALTAQQTGCKIAQEPKALPAEACNYSIYGMSPNGRYIYGGNPSGEAFCYDTQQDKTLTFPASSRIYAITDDGLLYMAKSEEGVVVCNMEQKTLHALESPEEAWPQVVPAYLSSDGQHLVGFLMDPTYSQESMTMPMYGTRAEDGSWTLHLLPTLKTDYFGDKPNYTQAFFCSPDGKKIIGRQNTYSGDDRPLFWEMGSDGTYTCSTPCDSFLYNLDVPLPGPMPKWGDYVTADYDTETELWEQQRDAYNKAYDEWTKKRDAVLSGHYTDLTWQEMATASGYWMISIHEVQGEGDDMTTVSYPGALNVNTGTVEYLSIPEAYGMGGLGRTQDGGWLCTPDGSEITRGLASHVIYPDGKKYPLLDYIKEQTGRDLSEFFTYSYKPSDDAEPVEKTDIGVVHFSGDGKTMTSCAVNMDRTTYRRNAYLRFDKSPLAIPLGVDPVELQPNGLSILWQGDALLFSEPATGTLYLYDTAGRLLDSYTLAAVSRLSLTDLAQGLYIGQVVTERGVSTVRFVR